jgi:hypothetical protein
VGWRKGPSSSGVRREDGTCDTGMLLELGSEEATEG